MTAKKPDGATFQTAIQFGKPYENEKHGWCCDLYMDGIDRPRFGAGVDSLQAVILTMSLAESILMSRLSNGWSFYWPDTLEPMNTSEIFEIDTFNKLRT